MREYRRAHVRYCPHLGHNVIMEGRVSEKGEFRLECLNKDDCGYNKEGCRNRLIMDAGRAVEVKSIGAV